MKKLLLLLLVATTSHGATLWKPAGYWYKEVTTQGSARFSKITDLQLKNLCTITPPIMPPTSLMPFVDTTKNVTPAVGFNTLRLQPTTELPLFPAEEGAFRIPCPVSHMSNDDPIVFPNMPGKSHHHTFFGNTSTNANSNLADLNSQGNSTCLGGIMNKSAYWIPSMIDTTTGAPIAPISALIYYKAGDIGFISTETITVPPKGLRMITGNSKAVPILPDPSPWLGTYTCNTPNGTTPWSKAIPNCNVGDVLTYKISFPQCWDGVNLDSPDHKSHMANQLLINTVTGEYHCPADHPVKIPTITINVNYANPVTDGMKAWRLSSDNYDHAIAGGYSAHADWVNGWDETLLGGIIKNCIAAKKDAHANLLCDGRTMY